MYWLLGLALPCRWEGAGVSIGALLINKFSSLNVSYPPLQLYVRRDLLQRETLICMAQACTLRSVRPIPQTSKVKLLNTFKKGTQSNN